MRGFQKSYVILVCVRMNTDFLETENYSIVGALIFLNFLNLAIFDFR